MDLNEVFDFLVEDMIYDRILEHSMDSHVNDLFKKDNTNIVDVCKIQNCNVLYKMMIFRLQNFAIKLSKLCDEFNIIWQNKT